MHTSIGRLFLVLFLLFTYSSTFAGSSESFELKGQVDETIDLDIQKIITLYRDEQRDSTCTRQEPYTVNECGYETKYRQSCRWVPGYQDCRDVYDRVCRYETRYKKECRTEPGRQQCRYEPGRQVCRTNSQGRYECRDIPGRQVCDNEPGRQVCRDVPYQDYVCHNVTRRQCDNVPGRNVCTNEPYQEYVCKDVVRYRSIDYACKVTVQIPYQVTKTLEHRVEFEFSGALELVDSLVSVSLNEDNQISLNAKHRNDAVVLTYSQMLTDRNEDQTISKVLVNVIDKKAYTAPLLINSHGLWMDKDGSYSLTVDQFSAQNFDLEIEVIKENSDELHFRKTFNASDFKKSNAKEGKVKLEIELKNYGFKALKNLFGGVKLKVNSTFIVAPISGQVLGEGINSSRVHSHKVKVFKD